MHKKDEIDAVANSNKSTSEKKTETVTTLEAGIKEVHAMLFFMGADGLVH